MHARGTPNWFESAEEELSGQLEEGRSLLREPDEFPVSSHAALPFGKPSGMKGEGTPGATLFGKPREDALELGTDAHAVFEIIEWMDEALPDPMPIAPNASPEALREVRRCLENKDTRSVFVRPEGDTVVWREKNFCLMLNGRLISGTFDRVVLSRDTDGSWSDAEIIDFKTDQGVETEAGLQAAIESHRSQLELYRKAVVRLTSLPTERVTCRLLFTRAPCLAIV